MWREAFDKGCTNKVAFAINDLAMEEAAQASGVQELR